MDFRYGRGILVQMHGVTHVVYRNHGIRVSLMCDDKWQNISRLVHGEYAHPTCVNCVAHPIAWNRLYNAWVWGTRHWMVA